MTEIVDKHKEVSQGLQDFIFVSKYARWVPELKRRETWDEAVDRVRDMHLKQYSFLNTEDKDDIRWAFEMVRQKKVLPSMRSMQFGGPAVEAHNARIFNCSVRHVDSIRAFAEIGYLMLCGCGTGIGLSKHFLSRLPDLVNEDDRTGSVITYVIDDTIEGWADSIEALLLCYFRNTAYSGRKIIFDYSKIRRKGTMLKTGGGRAPGYKPLKAAHVRIKKLLDRIIEEEKVDVIRPIHAYDILMYFADAVLSGGVRRTASSVIFDKDDEEMMNSKIYFDVEKVRESVDEDSKERHLRVWVNKKFYDVTMKIGEHDYDYNKLKEEKKISWLFIEPQRARSNNSVLLLRDNTSIKEFADIIIKTRQFGEPGFVWANHLWALFNPCYEVGFVPVTEEGMCGVQFCNLTTGNGTLINSYEDFELCIKAQAIIGTLQAGYTNFPYLSNVAKQLTEEEALIGLSITGVLTSPNILLNENCLQAGAKYAVEVNRLWADKIGINPAARVTLEKPEGTGGLAIGVTAPGIHADHADEYFRRIQVTKGDPLYEFFKIYNPHMCEESIYSANKTDDVITFPLKAKEGALVKENLSAIEHLEIIKKFQLNWVLPGGVNNKKDVTNNVSCTVVVRDNEWIDVVKYVYNNRQFFSAVSFLSYSGDKDYAQAPYEKVLDSSDRERYNMLLDKYHPVDFSKLEERSDDTQLVAESSCAGGACMV